jgi:peptidoglycan hydrolase-like protein with peptidoglycan-binding domain
LTQETRAAPEQIKATIDKHAWASPPVEPSAETIKRLQAALNKAGARLVVDGKMGLQTGMALADWQRTHGLRATGRLDPASERLLGLAAEGRREYETVVGPPRP